MRKEQAEGDGGPESGQASKPCFQHLPTSSFHQALQEANSRFPFGPSWLALFVFLEAKTILPQLTPTGPQWREG